MLDGLSGKEKYGFTGILVFSVVVAFGAGAVVSGAGSPTGAVTGSQGDLSEEEIKEKMSSLLDQQMEQQRQQFRTIANNSEGLEEDDLSIDSTIEDVSPCQFGSLYRVNVSVTGEAPAQLGNGTTTIDEKQVMYVSSDGRYLFQEPTDLEQPRPTEP